jgi:inosose dehydratase
MQAIAAKFTALISLLEAPALKQKLTRRDFLTSAAYTSAMLAAAPGFAASTRQRKIHIGYTGITWMNGDVTQAIQTVSSLGFYGFETFGDVLAKWQDQGGLDPVLEKNHLPLISGYCTINLTEPSRKADEMAKAVKWCGLIKKCNGRIFVVGPNPVKRDSYDFAANKANIISTLNELALVVEQQGLTPVLHQHTGTCIESRDETYAVLDAVDTRHLKFGPDVGQLTKGGQDAVKVVKDYLPIVQHMHLKDYNGKDPYLLGYCPLGQGKVNVPAILDMMEGRKISGMVMVELDNDFKNPSPTPPTTLATESRDYLRSIGVRFRV